MTEGLFQSDEAIDAQGLIEGEIGLVGTHQVFGRLDDLAIELGNLHVGHQFWIRVEPDTEKGVVFQGGLQQLFNKIHFGQSASLHIA
ncbi:MAG: hypothetical protein DDT28_01115 [Dehalococcoidia bacterium]|nr:hypothetical protein [Chloroflexota bacterium]